MPATATVDTTADTTQGAIRRNSGQPPAKKTAYLSQFCNVRQHSETDDIGLWLRGSRVRAPSVTLLYFPPLRPDLGVHLAHPALPAHLPALRVSPQGVYVTTASARLPAPGTRPVRVGA